MKGAGMRKFIFTFGVYFMILGMGMVLHGCADDDLSEKIDIGQSLSTVNALPCFSRANKVIPIEFPKDFGSHDRFQTEWWYYTGNLDTTDGRHFGYQLTFFRRALLCADEGKGNPTTPSAQVTPTAQVGKIDGTGQVIESAEAVEVNPTGRDQNGGDTPSQWRTGQLYLAHFAVTDVQSGRFYSDHSMGRQALGLAGAVSDPYRVWLGQWQVVLSSGNVGLESEGEGPKMSDFNMRRGVDAGKITVHMTAKSGTFALNLMLSSVKPTILQGDKGLSQKSEKEGNASYYFSMTRSETRGVIKTEAGEFEVTGTSWFDHEWSTSALGADEKGWDWIAIHLDDHRDLMVCQVRKADGRPNAFSFGCISHPDGQYDILDAAHFTLQIQDYWQSDTTGARYPCKWRLTIPKYDLDMGIAPYLKDQEHLGDFVYWEGCVQVSGEGVSGSGYVEMTGYF